MTELLPAPAATAPAAPAPLLHVQTRFAYLGEDGEPVAHLTVTPRHGTHSVENVWTHHAHRGLGYASHLLAELVTTFATTPLHLYVAANSGSALDDADLITWYARFGFVPTSVPGVLMRPASAPGAAPATHRLPRYFPDDDTEV